MTRCKSFSQRPRSCLRWRHPRAEHMDTPSIATAAVSDRRRTGLEDDTAISKAPNLRHQQTTHARLPCGLSIRHSQLLVHELRSRRFESDKSNNSRRSIVNNGAETIRHVTRDASARDPANIANVAHRNAAHSALSLDGSTGLQAATERRLTYRDLDKCSRDASQQRPSARLNATSSAFLSTAFGG